MQTILTLFIIKGYYTSSRIDCGIAKSLAQALLLPATFRTLYVILSRIFCTGNIHFGTELRPMFFLFMPAGHIATARDLGNAAETNNGIT